MYRSDQPRMGRPKHLNYNRETMKLWPSILATTQQDNHCILLYLKILFHLYVVQDKNLKELSVTVCTHSSRLFELYDLLFSMVFGLTSTYRPCLFLTCLFHLCPGKPLFLPDLFSAFLPVFCFLWVLLWGLIYLGFTSTSCSILVCFFLSLVTFWIVCF